jgi:serine/threonine-protein kinase
MPVALKFIEAEGDPADARARFEREARAAAQIRSPHVVQIIDHGVDADRPYIAMELLTGEDLGQRLRRVRRLSLPACAALIAQAAKALRRAHEAGIVHRDLKPANVYLARVDDDEVVKILDFGVAKMRRAGVIDPAIATQVGIVFGSPSYMSPEQARGARDIDHRTDLWSLAVIVFRALTGTKPFEGATLADLVVKLCVDPPPVASHVLPDLPPEIDAFFERAFARDPDHRFSSALEMAAAFQAAAGAPPRLVESGGAPSAAIPAYGPGSGPHVAFAPGTLTPHPTPPLGTSTMPSGGWGLLAAVATAVPPVAPAVGPPPVDSKLPAVAGPRRAPPLSGPPTPPAWPKRRIVAGGAGAGLLVGLALMVAGVRREAAGVPVGADSSSASELPGPGVQAVPIEAALRTEATVAPSASAVDDGGLTHVPPPVSAARSGQEKQAAPRH